jgi:hypothetical protein
VIVGSGEPAEIAAIADAVAGQEEAGVGGLRPCGRACGSRYGRNGEACRQNDSSEAVHRSLPVVFMDRSLSTHQGAHYSGGAARTPHRIRNERIMPKTDNKTKKKAPRNEPQRP